MTTIPTTKIHASRQGVTTLVEYEDLFRNAQREHVAVGEASVWYLSSSQAVNNILDYNPNARFIVMVRNPIEMASALHGQMLVGGLECVQDFSKAWILQEERRQGRRLPAFSWTRRRLLYGDICSLGVQLERLLSLVPAHRVLVVILDDLREDPRREYLRILRFLGVHDDGRFEFPVHNTAVLLRWPAVQRFFFCLSEIKTRLGIKSRSGIWTRLEPTNRVSKSRPPLPPDLEAALKEYFSSDVNLLGGLLNRDLG